MYKIADYNTPIKNLTVEDIRSIRDERLKQAVFHIYTFFQPINFGNLLFNDKDCEWYWGFDINKITILNIYDLLYSKMNRNKKMPDGRYKNINEVIESLHYSQSTYMGYKRSYATAVSNSGFTIDLDYYKEEKYKDFSPKELVKRMKSEGAFDMLEPDYVIYTGNGINLVYLLKNVNVNTNLSFLESEKNKLNIEKRRAIIKTLIQNFEPYGADNKCHDITRINKVVGGMNYKTKKSGEILDFDNVIDKTFRRRTLGHLYNQFIKQGYIIEREKKKAKKNTPKLYNYYVEDGEIITKERKEPKKDTPIKATKTRKDTNKTTNNDLVKECREYRVNIDGVIHLRNAHSLNMARIDDLVYLLNNRNDFLGNRNSFLHLLSVYLRKTTDDLDYIYNKIVDVNNSFPEKITNIEYLKNQIYKDELNYNYKNEDIIKMLQITEKEMRNLKTIISKEELYRRKNNKRRENRRNRDNLTNEEQLKLNKIMAIDRMSKRGLSRDEMAKRLRISKSYLSKLIKEYKNL